MVDEHPAIQMRSDSLEKRCRPPPQAESSVVCLIGANPWRSFSEVVLGSEAHFFDARSLTLASVVCLSPHSASCLAL